MAKADERPPKIEPIKIEVKPTTVQVDADLPYGTVYIAHTSGVGMTVTQRMWDRVYSKTGEYEVKKKQITK